MNSLKTSDLVALQLLMSEDLYSIGSEGSPQSLPASPEITPAMTSEPAVEVVQLSPPEAKPQEPSFFEYLGENNKYILILVKEPQHSVIAPKELETLTNILKGKKQEIKDVALVNLHKYPTATFAALKAFFACNSIVCFGINPGQLGLDGIQSNQITSIQGTKILATYTIAEMLSNVDKKKAFWDEMKKL